MNHAAPESSQLDILPYQVRERLVRSLLQDVPRASDVNLPLVARITSGLTEAELVRLCQEAVRIARYEQRLEVSGGDLEEALEVLLKDGVQLLLLDTEVTYQQAIHTVGQAFVARHNPVLGELQSITLLNPASPIKLSPPPRVEGDLSGNHALRVAQLDLLLAGQVAEEILLGTPALSTEPLLTTAMQVARQVVTQEEAGTGEAKRAWWRRLRRRAPAHTPLGLPSQQGDRLARQLVEERWTTVRELLARYRQSLEPLIEHLLHEETVDQTDITRILVSARSSGAV